MSMNENEQFVVHLLFLNASHNTEDSLPLPLLKWLSQQQKNANFNDLQARAK